MAWIGGGVDVSTGELRGGVYKITQKSNWVFSGRVLVLGFYGSGLWHDHFDLFWVFFSVILGAGISTLYI
jgi:hypothetical protein